MIILGIDPGTRITGFAVLRLEQSTQLLNFGYLKLGAGEITERIGTFHVRLEELIKLYNVNALALETPFLGKNAQNFLKLGYLRGILHLLAHQNKLSVHEFAPRLIKQQVVGHGGADKDQVARVLQSLFPGLVTPDKLDATDALAVALCAASQIRLTPAEAILRGAR